jgi:thiopeptide-type bacteriocin biosynthesis protein
VRSGRVVLSRARWLLERDDIGKLTRGDAGECFQAFQDLRRERGLPTRTMVADGDHELLVDAGNVLSVEAMLALAKQRGQLYLIELFPGPEQLCAHGPEGRFTHELVVPFRRRSPAAPQRTPVPARTGIRRTFPPGSEWLYVKLYTGTSTADQVLRELVAPLTRQALATSAADRWFFIRYSDPHWHLRLRFHGDPKALYQEVLAPLQATAARFVDAGHLWRVQVDTYEREIERYGGAEGTELAERLAHVDSQAALEIVEALEGDEGATARWRLALRGVDLLLDDLGLEGDGKLAVAKDLQGVYAREFGVGAVGKKQMADRLRQEGPEMEGLFDTEWDAGHPLAPGLAALARRSQRLAPIVAELRAREAEKRLTVTVAELAVSYVHMFVNRLMRSEARAQEVVLHDFLYRILQSRTARSQRHSTESKRRRAS